jgi:hypothetical protein
MRHTFLTLSLGIVLASCGGSAETPTEGTGTTETTIGDGETTEETTEQPAAGAIDTPDNAANTFCAKMQEVEAAAEADKERLEDELNDLENKIEAEHDGDDAWFNEFETKLEALCPEA